MFGRLLCLIGWHDWGYRYEDGAWGRPYHRPSLREVRHQNARYVSRYECLRCGIRP